MASVCKVLGIGKRGLSIISSGFHTISASTSTSSSSSAWKSLLLKLAKESNSNIKPTLDLELNYKHSFLWEPLITSLTSSSPQKAQLVLEWKLEKLLELDERDPGQYAELIYLCGKVHNVRFALRVFTLMEAHGVRPTSTVFNSLICACLSSDSIMTSLSLFEIMQRLEDCKPNSATYNAFMSTYSNLGDVAKVQVWYLESKKAGFPPTVETFEYLIAGSIKSQNFDIADKFYEEMLLSGIIPNMSILQNMIVGLCQQKNFNKVKEFLKFILEGGWNVNRVMAKEVVEIYSDVGKVKEMEELLVNFLMTNQDSEVLSQVHCGIIRMYAKSDRLDDLEFSVGRMLKQGLSFTCPDDIEKVICSYFRREAYERLDLVLERIHSSYKFTRSSYDLLVAGYRRAGLTDKVKFVMKEMQLAGFSVS